MLAQETSLTFIIEVLQSVKFTHSVLLIEICQILDLRVNIIALEVFECHYVTYFRNLCLTRPDRVGEWDS